MSNSNNNKILYELTQINESLDEIKLDKLKNSNKYNINDYCLKNNFNNIIYTQNCALNSIYSINKGIDSIYDHIKLIKGNKINSKILYNISNYTQTEES